MDIAIISSGAIVARENGVSFLFGAPQTILNDLQNSGIEVPEYAFTTNLRAPGLGNFSIKRFKEMPLNMNGLKATPIKHKHGTDYSIESDTGRVLFSERGDVSVKDTEGFDLAIIKNKHRADTLGDHVITWPWVDTEYSLDGNSVVKKEEIKLKVWSSMDDVPDNLKKLDGVSLTLDQANEIARIAEGAGSGSEEEWGIAISTFKKGHTKKDSGWEVKEKESVNSQLDRLRNSFNEKFPPPKDQPSTYWLIDADFDTDTAYLNKNGATKALGFRFEGADYIFDPESEWKNASQGWNIELKQLLTKEEVNYTSEGTGQRCKDCKYFQDKSCSLVEGDIDPNYTCDKFSGMAQKEEKISDNQLIAAIQKEGGKQGDIRGIYINTKNLDEYYVDFGDWAKEETIKAVKSVLGSVEYEMEGPPPKDKEWTQLYKEMSEYGPVRRFGDVLTAALHKAYNDISDHYFEEGYLSQDERMVVAKAVGPALSALRDGLGPELLDKSLNGYHNMTPFYNMKEEDTSVIWLDLDRIWYTNYKDAEGNDRWATVSSVAVKDRQEETLTPEAMDWALGFAKLTGYKGPLRYRHIPGLDGGECTQQVRVGDYLFESGIYYDTPLGRSMKALSQDPEFRISVGLLYGKEDIENGKYKRAVLFERSMTKGPANPATAITSFKENQMKTLTEQQLKDVADELSLPLNEVRKMYETALAQGKMFGLKEFTEEVLKTNGGGGQTAADKDADKRDEYEEMTKEEMVQILEGLSVKEFNVLETLMKEAKGKQDEEEDEEDEEEELSDKDKMAKLRAMQKKKEKQLSDRVDQLEDALLSQTKSIQTLTEAVLASTTNPQKSLAAILTQLPREKASRFVSSLKGEEDGDDDPIMAKLKEIEGKFLQQKSGSGNGIYDMFTSQTLNRGR